MSGGMMRKWQLLVGGLVVAAVLVAVGMWALWPKPDAQAAQQQTAAPVPGPTGTPSPSGQAAPSPPAPAELRAIEDGIASGDSATVLQLMGERTDGTVSPDTLSQLKAMAIRLDPSTLRQIGSGPAWELTAKDASGKSWRVGLLRKPGGQLVVAYEEPVQ